MLIAGAKRHAKEVLQVVEDNEGVGDYCFFDDISKDISLLLYNKYTVLTSIEEVKHYFKNQQKFILAVGSPYIRYLLSAKLSDCGGLLSSVISRSAFIGNYGVELSPGLNVMQNAIISNDVVIKEGTLVNAFVSVHHDVVVGRYCELSPHSVLLGGCKIGSYSSIGSNATILPNVVVGENSIVGAGSVVTKDIPDNTICAGVPCRIIKTKPSIPDLA